MTRKPVCKFNSLFFQVFTLTNKLHSYTKNTLICSVHKYYSTLLAIFFYKGKNSQELKII